LAEGSMLMVMGREDSAAAGVRRLPRRTSREVITYESPRGEREREGGRKGGWEGWAIISNGSGVEEAAAPNEVGQERKRGREGREILS